MGGFIFKLTWNRTSHICWSRPLWMSCHSATLRIVFLLPCFHPDFEKHFWSKLFFFFEILKKNKTSGTESIQEHVASLLSRDDCSDVVWPDLPRYNRPHVNFASVSSVILPHCTSDRHTATLHSHTAPTLIQRKGCSWRKRSLAGRIFKYVGAHCGKCRYF